MSELRQRPAAAGAARKGALDRAASVAVPALASAASALAYAIPHARRVVQAAGAARAALPSAALQCALGVALLLFGAAFRATAAAAEAWILAADEPLRAALREIGDHVEAIAVASAEDDKKDDDGDGIADVKQIDDAQLARRKADLFLATVDPHELGRAMSVAYAGLLAVLATLRAKFAATVALGAYLGQQVHELCGAALERKLKESLPDGHAKWARAAAKSATGALGVAIAWALSSALAAAHSALRGANLAVDGGLALMGVKPTPEARQLVVYALAACGFYFQLLHGFGLPFLLSVVLFPAVLIEKAITFLVYVL